MKISLKFICILLLLLLFSIQIVSSAAIENIEKTLGPNTTSAMLNEIVKNINKYSTVTNEQILETIKNITTVYGLELNDVEIKEVYNYIRQDVTATITDNLTLRDRFKLFIDDMTRVVEETFPEAKDKEVIVIIPRLSQVDDLVKQGIYYFIRNILPLIDS